MQKHLQTYILMNVGQPQCEAVNLVSPTAVCFIIISYLWYVVTLGLNLCKLLLSHGCVRNMLQTDQWNAQHQHCRGAWSLKVLHKRILRARSGNNPSWAGLREQLVYVDVVAPIFSCLCLLASVDSFGYGSNARRGVYTCDKCVRWLYSPVEL